MYLLPTYVLKYVLTLVGTSTTLSLKYVQRIPCVHTYCTYIILLTMKYRIATYNYSPAGVVLVIHHCMYIYVCSKYICTVQRWLFSYSFNFLWDILSENSLFFLILLYFLFIVSTFRTGTWYCIGYRMVTVVQHIIHQYCWRQKWT